MDSARVGPLQKNFGRWKVQEYQGERIRIYRKERGRFYKSAIQYKYY